MASPPWGWGFHPHSKTIERADVYSPPMPGADLTMDAMDPNDEEYLT
jgi:hypothetical protein